jgi:Tfp pilus assembly protein PilO
MDQLKRYTWPIAIGGAVFVIALIAILGWIIPEGHKVSAQNAQKATLLVQETSLQAEIDGLEHEQAQEPKNCSSLRKDRSLVPQTPTVDLFLHQISQLASTSGTTTPSVAITDSGTPGSGPSAAGAQTVGISLSVAGTYQQVVNFLGGLDKVTSLQRLFPVSSVTLTGGAASGSSASGTTYSLQLQGNIYYSTSSADVCSTGPSQAGSSST